MAAHNQLPITRPLCDIITTVSLNDNREFNLNVGESLDWPEFRIESLVRNIDLRVNIESRRILTCELVEQVTTASLNEKVESRSAIYLLSRSESQTQRKALLR